MTERPVYVDPVQSWYYRWLGNGKILAREPEKSGYYEDIEYTHRFPNGHPTEAELAVWASEHIAGRRYAVQDLADAYEVSGVAATVGLDPNHAFESTHRVDNEMDTRFVGWLLRNDVSHNPAGEINADDDHITGWLDYLGTTVEMTWTSAAEDSADGEEHEIAIGFVHDGTTYAAMWMDTPDYTRPVILRRTTTG